MSVLLQFLGFFVGLVLFAHRTVFAESELLDSIELIAFGDVVEGITDRTLQTEYLTGTFFCFCHTTANCTRVSIVKQYPYTICSGLSVNRRLVSQPILVCIFKLGKN